MTRDEINRLIAEKLGLLDKHRIVKVNQYVTKCLCGKMETENGYSLHHHIKAQIPDFFSDSGKVQLLREMRKREDWKEFAFSLYDRCETGSFRFVVEQLILDDEQETGLLAMAAEEWLEKEGK